MPVSLVPVPEPSDVGPTDTIAAGQIDLQGLSAVRFQRRVIRVEPEGGGGQGVVRNDTTASCNGTVD